MHYFRKNVRYLKFFEDIKIVQNDELNARLAIVFCGKERLIHIFDSSPYRDYMPIKINDNQGSSSQDNTTNSNNPPAAMDYPHLKKDDVDIKKLFKDISTDHHNHQQQAPQLILKDNQHYIILNSQQLQKTETAIDNQFEISKFDLLFEASIKKISIKLDIIKPKIKTKLLSVIQTNTIKGVEWFSFQTNIPLLLVVNIDNFIGVYRRRNVDNNKKTLISNGFLQSQPFTNFPEDWSIYGSASQSIPIKDYYLKPSGDNVHKLYTIHADNNIYFWFIIYQVDSLKITPNFIISFDHSFIIDNIVINSNETFLYCFNSKGMQIYKLSSVLPFNLVYVFWFEEANFSPQKEKKRIDRLIPLSSSSFSSEAIDEEIIDMNENVTREEDKFFKDLQKPIFSLIENVLFIQLYNSNEGSYALMYFDTQGLTRIFKDIRFFEKCRKGEEKTLMKKFFVSSKNFSFALSPNLYLRTNEGKLSVTSEIEKDDDELLTHLHQILLISYNNNNEFYSLPVMMDKVSTITPTVITSFNSHEDAEDEEYKVIIKWIEKNTIMISSLKFLFSIVKYCDETEIFGIPVSYEKIKLFLINK